MKILHWALLLGSFGLLPSAGAQESTKTETETKTKDSKTEDARSEVGRALSERIKEVTRAQRDLQDAQRAVAKAQAEAQKAQAEMQRAFPGRSSTENTGRRAYTIMRPVTGTAVVNKSSDFVRTYGLDFGPADSVLQAQLGLEKNEGMVVLVVNPDSPADKAGLKRYDILTKVDKKPVHDVVEARKILTDRAQATALLNLLRAGKAVEVTMTKPEAPESKEPFYFGVVLNSVDPSLRAQLPALPEGTGLIVTEVTPNSPAAKAEAKPFDIVFKLDDTPVKTNEGLAEQLQKGKGEPVRVTLLRKGEPKVLTLTPERRPATRSWTTSGSVKLDFENLAKDLKVATGKGMDGWEMFTMPDGSGNSVARYGLVRPGGAVGVEMQADLEKQVKALNKQMEDLQKAIELMSKNLKPQPETEAKKSEK